MGGCAARENAPVRHVIRRVSSNKFIEPKDRENLESYYLFWLDNTARSPEFMEASDELRAVINHVEIFESNEECVRRFEKIKQGKIFLIANLTQGLLLLPIIHHHQELCSIYMYPNRDNIDMNEITYNFNKVRGIHDSFATAKRYLEDDVKMHTDLDEPMIMNFNEDDNESESQERFNLFLKVVNTKADDVYDDRTQKHVIDTYEEYYKGNDSETNFIDEFSRLYKAEDAITWYMRGSCLHRLLARAFNEQNMCLLVDMYSFIVDVNRNIKTKSLTQSSKLHVFRGQFLSAGKLSLFKNHINQLVTMHCFLSAQISRDDVVNLLDSIDPIDKTFVHIIFEIDASQNCILVDDSESSTSKTALFMLGSVFKIVDVTETTVRLSQYTATSDDNFDLANESPEIIKGILTYLKDGPAKAIRYFHKNLLGLSETDLVARSSIHGQLGYLEQQVGHSEIATQMYEKSMNDRTIEFRVYLFYLDQAAKHYANVLRDWEKAKVIWLQKLEIQNALHIEEGKAQTYENLARAALMTKQNDTTIEYTSAAIKILPDDHPHLSYLRQQLEHAKTNVSLETTS
ncbi:unnamed protein product [Rotaria socialis]|uniref:Uncharacterized protein n=1 Tax=Rotaria socialis TaxID=392032 RepID=A0A821QK02_9BILA|nr:unnamed protein product [Rotaria socialis]CAF4827296.1 unnamed protein product [Rotaria socialis]